MFVTLVGSGEYLPGMEPVDQELIHRLGQPARVVCLPTAAGTEGAERIAYWSNLGVTHFTRLGAQVAAVPVIDRASANDSALAEQIAQANFVYLSGGKPQYLYQTLAGSRVWSAIEQVLANGGVLAGCSAGAMVQGEKFYAFPGLKEGFGFVPGALIIPHFDEFGANMLQSVALVTGRSLTILGIEGYTALVRQGDHYEVLGSGGVTVINHAGKKRYTQGPLPTWNNAHS